MVIESYSDLQREIQRYQSEVDRLNDAQKQYLNNLIEMQKAYNTFVNNLQAIQQIDVANASNMEEAQNRLETLQNEIIEARKILPESLQREIRENAVANQVDLNNGASRESTAETQNNVDYRSEYERLTNEFNQILGDRDLDEIGLNDFDEIERKYNEVSAKRNDLFDAVNGLKDQVSEEELNDLLGIDSGLKEKIDREINEFNIIKETKQAFKEDKEKEIESLKEKMEATKEQQADIENKIKELLGNGLFDSIVDKYREIATKLQESLTEDEKKLEKLNDELGIILNGGKIEMTTSVDDIIKQTQEEVEERDREIEAQNQAQSEAQTQQSQPQPKPQTQAQSQQQSNSQSQSQSQTQHNPQAQGQSQQQTPPIAPTGNTQGAANQNRTQTVTPPQPKLPNTLDNLVKSGKLPKNLSRAELVRICGELNIEISNRDTVLSDEQIERLTNDHEIQVALLNQRIADRNKRKISEYDKLITKYESIIQDKMEGKEFSDEYVAKVETLLERSKEERQIYVDRNERITAYDHSEVLGGISEIRDYGLDDKATGINDKLRAQYEKLDSLREERKESRSKFKQKIGDSRIKKTLAKIEKLKGKKAVISDKQTQIVNKNASKYISKMSKKIKKHLTRQGRVEMSVDKINDLSQRIERNSQERQGIAFDRQAETRLLDRIGMAFEDKVLGAQTATLEGQRKMEEFVGRLR